MKSLTKSNYLVDVFRASSNLLYRYAVTCTDEEWAVIESECVGLYWLTLEEHRDGDLFNIEGLTRDTNSSIVILRVHTFEFYNVCKRFGYVQCSPKELQEDVNLQIRKPLDMSAVFRSFVIKNDLVDIGGRDDLFISANKPMRAINPDIAGVDFYDPTVVYPDGGAEWAMVESNVSGTDKWSSSSGQLKLQLLVWCVAIAVGKKTNLLYVGGAPGDNYQNIDIPNYYHSITCVDPRAGDSQLSYIRNINSEISDENIDSILAGVPEPRTVIFDVRKDKGDKSYKEWQRIKHEDTLAMQRWADRAINHGYLVASIKFSPTDSCNISLHPTFYIPTVASDSTECRTLQTKICSRSYLNYKNYKNFCIVQSCRFPGLWFNRNYVKFFYGLGVYKRDYTRVERLPMFVFEVPRSLEDCVDRTKTDHRRWAAFFVMNQVLRPTLQNIDYFSFVNRFDAQNSLVGYDYTQFVAERVHDYRGTDFQLVTFAEFCWLNDLRTGVLYSRETENISIYIRRRVSSIQSMCNTQTFNVRPYMRRLACALMHSDNTTYRAFRKQSTLEFLSERGISHAEVNYSTGEFMFDDVVCSASGHCLGMLIAYSFGACDINSYLAQITLNLNGDYLLEGGYEPDRADKLWHTRVDYSLAAFMYEKLSYLGVPVDLDASARFRFV